MLLESGQLKSNIFTNFLWEFFSTGFAKTIGFISFIILARYLIPDEFGLFAFVQIILSFVVLLLDLGITQTIIKSRDSDIANSAFIINLFFAVVFFFILFFLSPLIAAFFNKRQLASILRIAAISFFFIPFISIQNAILVKEMRFKEASLYNTVNVAGSSVFSVIFAIYGMGVWSFIYGQIIGQMIQTFVMAYYSRMEAQDQV
jgi:teichuronic acid exporter